MYLSNIIEALRVNSKNSAMLEQKVRVCAVNSMGVVVSELFNGTVGELINHDITPGIFGAGIAKEWMVMSYSHVAYTIEDEAIPVYNRDIEVRVI